MDVMFYSTTTLRRLTWFLFPQKLIPICSPVPEFSASIRLHLPYICGTSVRMSYLSEFLCRIGAKSKTMYNMFYLHLATQTWIIALGIKKQPRHYRGSRAGRSAFGHIHSRITSHEKKSNPNLKWSVVLTNLLNIQLTKERHTHLSLVHVNAWSIRNKIGPFQHYLQDEKIDLCAVTETWLKPDNMVHPREITPPGLTSYPNQDLMEDKEAVSPLSTTPQ